MQLNKHTLHLIGAITGSVLLSLAIGVPAQQAPPLPPIARPLPKPGASPQLGNPLQGLTREQLAAFGAGFVEFTNIENAGGWARPDFQRQVMR